MFLIFVSSDIQYLLRHCDAAQTKCSCCFYQLSLESICKQHAAAPAARRRRGGVLSIFSIVVVLESICKQHAVAPAARRRRGGV